MTENKPPAEAGSNRAETARARDSAPDALRGGDARVAGPLSESDPAMAPTERVPDAEPDTKIEPAAGVSVRTPERLSRRARAISRSIPTPVAATTTEAEGIPSTTPATPALGPNAITQLSATSPIAATPRTPAREPAVVEPYVPQADAAPKTDPRAAFAQTLLSPPYRVPARTVEPTIETPDPPTRGEK